MPLGDNKTFRVNFFIFTSFLLLVIGCRSHPSKNEDDLNTKEESFYGSDYWVANVGQIRGHLADRNIQNICLIDPK